MLGAVRFFTEAAENMNGLISKPNDQMIYWAGDRIVPAGRLARKPGYYTPRLTLHAAPLHVGHLMKKHIWDAKKSVVLTSATLRAATPATRNQPSFDHLQERLSADDVATLAVGSPFDYKSSTLLYLVTDIPEPNQAGYQQFIERALIDLFRASQGRGLALFTSYTQLRATSKAIAPPLLEDGIMVYEQGDGTSRRVMLEQFRAADKAVLLGTRSFWEGVDIQGDKLERPGDLQAAVRRADRPHLRGAQRDVRGRLQRVLGAGDGAALPPGLRPADPLEDRPGRRRRAGQTADDQRIRRGLPQHLCRRPPCGAVRSAD